MSKLHELLYPLLTGGGMFDLVEFKIKNVAAVFIWDFSPACWE